MYRCEKSFDDMGLKMHSPDQIFLKNLEAEFHFFLWADQIALSSLSTLSPFVAFSPKSVLKSQTLYALGPLRAKNFTPPLVASLTHKNSYNRQAAVDFVDCSACVEEIQQFQLSC